MGAPPSLSSNYSNWLKSPIKRHIGEYVNDELNLTKLEALPLHRDHHTQNTHTIHISIMFHNITYNKVTRLNYIIDLKISPT